MRIGRTSVEFFLTSLPVVVTPGTGVLYVMSAGISRGTRAGVIASIGCASEPHSTLRLAGLSGVFMLLTFVVFIAYGKFAASIRDHVVSRPRILTWIRRTFAGLFAALGVSLLKFANN